MSARKPCRPLIQPPGSSVSPRNASCATQRTRNATASPTALQLPHHAQIAPITIRSSPMWTTIEKPPCASSASSPAPRDVRSDRERLNQHADDDDRAAGEHEPQRCSSHARDHTTPAGR